MDLSRTVIALLISFFPMLCSAQIGGECVGSLLSEDDIFRNCTYTLLPIIQQTLTMGQNPDGSPSAGLMEPLCSEENRPYLDCFVSSMSQCPDDFESFLSSVGLDAADFYEFGSFDLPCSIYVGECSSVKQCFPQFKNQSFISSIGDVGGIGGLVPGQAATNMTEEMQSNFTTPLSEFYGLIKHLCGFMKLEYDCAMTEFGKCADSIEETLDRQVPLFVVDILIADSHMNFSVLGEDIISLLENDCPSMDVQQILTDSCSLDGLDSQQFMDCYNNAMLAYENDMNGCILQDVLSYCTNRYISDTCDEAATTYLIGQLPLFQRINGMECIVTTTTTVSTTTTEQQIASSQPFTVIKPSGPATNAGTVNQLATNGNVMANNGNGNVNPTAAGQNSHASCMNLYQAMYLLVASLLFCGLFRSM